MIFEAFHLKQGLLKAISGLGYSRPTPVQEKVIPAILAGKDVIVKAQTGSGKTAAFAIPLCEKILWEENKPQALVLSPTRELAMQIAEDCFHIGRFERMKVVALYGKAPFHVQQRALKQKTHIVVGTPGRVMDHITRGTLELSNIKYLVIDEADEMLRMGFMEQVEAILQHLPKARNTLLFSATYAPAIEKMCNTYLDQPEMVAITAKKLTSDQIEECWYQVPNEKKLQAICALATVYNPESCMIFANTKERVEKVTKSLKEAGFAVRMLHGGMEQRERMAVMQDFRRGRFRYLVATDVAARGIDIDHVTHVINVEVPENKEYYVHRIGRTGRVGRKGYAILLVSDSEKPLLEGVIDYIKHPIMERMLPDHMEVELARGSFEEKMHRKIITPSQKGEVLSKEIMKLHINAGKKTKMRPVDIVGTLCNLKGMTAQDIGIINIQDVSTFVEILNNKGESVYQQLQTTPIKGRLRKVSKVECAKA